jgi:hypothetical protein
MPVLFLKLMLIISLYKQANTFAFSRPFAVNVLTVKSLAYAIVITCAGAPSSENTF